MISVQVEFIAKAFSELLECYLIKNLFLWLHPVQTRNLQTL